MSSARVHILAFINYRNMEQSDSLYSLPSELPCFLKHLFSPVLQPWCPVLALRAVEYARSVSWYVAQKATML